MTDPVDSAGAGRDNGKLNMRIQIAVFDPQPATRWLDQIQTTGD
jgi:hypothetical protein